MSFRLIAATAVGILLALGIGLSSRVIQYVKNLRHVPVPQVTITIPEGWDLKDIGAYLERQGIGTAKDFADMAKENGKSLEGYLFPDTYRLYKGATLKDVISKMQANFMLKLTPELESAIKNSGHSIKDIITLASIVEKEVPNSSDRPIVAGIFWKRLEQGMPLQADSTLNYVTGNKSSSLSSEELKIDSPYNTYKNKGLPPTPIGNPGIDAIRASVFPKDSPYLYFLSTLDGKTIFSKTFEEHVAAKRKYLRD